MKHRPWRSWGAALSRRTRRERFEAILDDSGVPTALDALLASGHLTHYHLAHSARADLCRRLGRLPEARASYEKALALAREEPERRFLAGRLRDLK